MKVVHAQASTLSGWLTKPLGKCFFADSKLSTASAMFFMWFWHCAPGRFARGLNRRQQERHQDTDDGNNDQQLDEGKAASRDGCFELRDEFAGFSTNRRRANIGGRSAFRTRDHVSSLHTMRVQFAAQTTWLATIAQSVRLVIVAAGSLLTSVVSGSATIRIIDSKQLHGFPL